MEGENKIKSKKVLKWVLILGIMIVVNLFFNYALKIFYTQPQWNDFCGNNAQVVTIPTTQDSCVSAGGQWSTNFKQQPPRGINDARSPIVGTKDSAGFCNPNFTCSKNYESSRNIYDRNIFVGLVIFGVLLIIGSFFIAGFEAVSLGLSFGGVLSLIVGALRYWSAMDDYVRVVVLGVALVALIWLGVKKFKD